MKFGVQFEFHKIPEWYTDYLDYVRFKQMISAFKKKVKRKWHLSGRDKSSILVLSIAYNEPSFFMRSTMGLFLTILQCLTSLSYNLGKNVTLLLE